MEILLFSFFLASTLAHLDPTISGRYPEENFPLLFEEFKQKFNRTYENKEEEENRYKIFVENLIDINAKNAKSFKMVQYGINHFTDLSDDEMDDDTGCVNIEEDLNVPELPVEMLRVMTESDENFDWRDRNVVTDVKSQGSCGSCWAFSVIGSIESNYAIMYNEVPPKRYSEQQLVDCTIDNGCGGGRLSDALRYIAQESRGLNYEHDYPYTAQDNQCSADTNKFAVSISGYYKLPAGEENLKQIVRNIGPVSTIVNTAGLKKYRGGIFPGDTCRPKFTHAVLVVGYGVEDSVPYWIIKNSWGPEFGENGYYRMVRGTGACWIGIFGFVPRVEKIRNT